MNKRLGYNRTDLGKSFGLAVAVMLLAQIVLSLAFSPLMDQSLELPDWAFWLMQALYTLCVGSVAFLYAKVSKTSICATKVNKPPRLSHVCWGCLSVLFLIALMLPTNEWLMNLIESAGLPRPSVDLPEQVVPMIVVACILPSFTEEIVFRGTIAQSLANSKHKLASLAVCGALFALFHLNPAQTVHQFVLGALLTLLTFRSGSVWTAVVVHLFNNLVAVLLSFVLTENLLTDYGWIFVVVGLIGFSLCTFGYLKTTQSSWGKQQGAEDAACDKVDLHQQMTSNVILTVAVTLCAFLWGVSLVGG